MDGTFPKIYFLNYEEGDDFQISNQIKFTLLWLLGVELRKSIALTSLNFLKGYEKSQIWSCPQLLYAFLQSFKKEYWVSVEQ